jgi:hypothetical protein
MKNDDDDQFVKTDSGQTIGPTRKTHQKGCFTQNVPREEIGFFGFSIRSASYRYTEVRQEEYRFELMPFLIKN